MADIELWSGLRDLGMEKQIAPVLSELSRYQNVTIDRMPGSNDIPRFRYVGEMARLGLDKSRDQVCLDGILDAIPRLTRAGEPGADKTKQKIILFEHDLFSKGLNWCFGVYSQRGGHSMVVLSNARMEGNEHFQYLIAHELGHMYGAAKKGRTNTAESLGSHCINDLCVMQQKLTVRDSLEHLRKRRIQSAPFYCEQCQDELMA